MLSHYLDLLKTNALAATAATTSLADVLRETLDLDPVFLDLGTTVNVTVEVVAVVSVVGCV